MVENVFWKIWLASITPTGFPDYLHLGKPFDSLFNRALLWLWLKAASVSVFVIWKGNTTALMGHPRPIVRLYKGGGYPQLVIQPSDTT